MAKRFEKLMDHLDSASLYDPKELLLKISENKKLSAIDSAKEFSNLVDFYQPKLGCPVGTLIRYRTRVGTEFTVPGALNTYTMQTCYTDDNLNEFSIDVQAKSPSVDLEINDPLNFSDIKGTIVYVNKIAPFDIAFNAECSINLNQEFIYLKDHNGVLKHNFFEVKPYVNNFRCSGAQSETLDLLILHARHGEEKVSLEKLKEMKDVIVTEMTEDTCKTEDKRDDDKSHDEKRQGHKQVEQVEQKDFKSPNASTR